MISKIENFIWCFMFALGIELPRSFISRIYNYLKHRSAKR